MKKVTIILLLLLIAAQGFSQASKQAPMVDVEKKLLGWWQNMNEGYKYLVFYADKKAALVDLYSDQIVLYSYAVTKQEEMFKITAHVQKAVLSASGQENLESHSFSMLFDFLDSDSLVTCLVEDGVPVNPSDFVYRFRVSAPRSR